MKIYQTQRIPWWARPWRHNHHDGSVDVLSIPICWIARLLYNVWVPSFRFRRNALEHKLTIATDSGRADGYSKGYTTGYAKGLEKGLSKREDLVSEAASNLLGRFLQIAKEDT